MNKKIILFFLLFLLLITRELCASGAVAKRKRAQRQRMMQQRANSQMSAEQRAAKQRVMQQRAQQQALQQPKQQAQTSSGEIIEIDDWLVDFVHLFRDTTGIDADRSVGCRVQ